MPTLKYETSEIDRRLEMVTELDTEIETISEVLTARIDSIQRAIGTPAVASTVGEMTDKTKVYVYTGESTEDCTNGYWCYWNGSKWTDGGLYIATVFDTDDTLSEKGEIADAKGK